MAYKEDKVAAVLQQYLQPGEQLYNFAFGVKQPPFLLILLLMCLAVVPGVIATALLTKNFLIGLTNARLIVVRFGGNLKPKEVFDFPLMQLPPVKTSTGPLFTHITIQSPQRPFVAKFHRMGMKSNREQSMAIAAALETRQLPPGQAA
jgi:hypothetical protein